MAKLNDNFTLRAPVPVDDKLGWWDEAAGAWKPFTSRQDAIDKTPHYRFRTMTLPVEENGDVVEYWFKMGVQDEDLVLKTSQADLSNYYTKTELQTSGQSQVHWDNITNVPDLSVTWENITGDQSVIGNAGFTNTANYITSADLPPIQSPLTFENGLREDGGVVKLGLDLTSVGTTNNGLLTEQTSLVLGDLVLQNYTSYNLYSENSLGIQKSIGGVGTQSIEFSTPDYATPNAMLIVDAINEKGIEEAADYSANKTAFSYVTKMMLDAVEAQIPDLPGFGLSWNTNTNKIDWGTELAAGLHGVIISDEEVLFIGKIGGFMSNLGSITTIGSANGGIGLTATITGVIQHGFSFYNAPNGGYTGDTPPVVFTDSLGIGGLHYESDYSANYTNRSLVDKEYVDNLIPDLTGYATEQWVLDQNYLSSISSSWNINTGDLTIQGNTHNLDGRYMLRSNTITSGYGIIASADFSNPVSIEVDTDVLDNRYLRKDTDDSNNDNILTTGYFINNTAATFNGGIYTPFLPQGSIADQMLVYDPSDERVKYIDMPNFGGTFNIANNAGTLQFSVGSGETLRFNATGDASVAFNAGTKTITINSSGGSTGGGVDSWNARTGAVVPAAGDYNTSLVDENPSALYFTEARVRASTLTGLSVTNSAIINTDSVLTALGKAQGQINSLVPESRSITINGTAGNITVSGGTQTLAANRTWTINLPNKGTAGTYTKVVTDAQGRVSSGGNITVSDLPPSVIQTLTHDASGSNAGNITISGGNTVEITNVGRASFSSPDRSVPSQGFYPYYNTTGSTGFPATTGGGFAWFRSNSTMTGAFHLWTAANGTNTLYYNIGDGASFNGWEIIASRDWVTSQIPTVPTNYVTTDTTQSSAVLTGIKNWGNYHTWAPTNQSPIIQSGVSIGFSSGNGAFIQGGQFGSATQSFILRGYNVNGAQLNLNEGGINFNTTQSLFYSGAPILTQNSTNIYLSAPGSGAVHLRPSGSASSTNQATFGGSVTLSALAGTGTQMVVANASGVLSRQAIPIIPAAQTLYSAGSIGQYGISGGNAIYIQALGNAEALNANVDNIELVQNYFQPFRMTASAADYSSVFTGFRSMRQSNASVSYGFDMGMNFTGSLNGKIAVRRYTGSSWSSLEALATENWVKSWGLGAFTNNNGTVADANTPSETQFFSGTSATTNKPPGTGHTYIHISRISTAAHQLAFDYNNDEAYFRRLNTTWSPWYKLWHDGNLTGAATTITTSNLTANRALISNGSGKVAVSAVTSTELGYLDGVTSNVQTQLNGKAPTTHNHTWSQLSGGSTALIPGAGSSTTYGSLDVGGSKSSYSGINFTDAGNSILMVNNTSGRSGLYKGGWVWAFEGDGTLYSGTVPWSNISGQVSVTAGNGLTGGGALTASRSLAVGAGDGITVNTSNVAVNNTVLRTTGNQTKSGVLTLSSELAAHSVKLDTAASSGTVINMASVGLLRLSSISSNTTYTMSNNADGRQVQCIVTNTNLSNNVTVTVTGATLLGSNIVQSQQQAVISIINFGDGRTVYTVVSGL